MNHDLANVDRNAQSHRHQSIRHCSKLVIQTACEVKSGAGDPTDVDVEAKFRICFLPLWRIRGFQSMRQTVSRIFCPSTPGGISTPCILVPWIPSTSAQIGKRRMIIDCPVVTPMNQNCFIEKNYFWKREKSLAVGDPDVFNLGCPFEP